RGIAIAVAAGLFLAVSGAFAGEEVPLATRLLYWIPVMIAGGVFGRLIATLVARIPRAMANEWVFGVLLALAISAPATILVWAYSNAFFGQKFTLATVPFYAGAVFVISLAMTSIMMLVGRPGRMTHAPADSPTAPAPQALPRF